MNLSPCLTMEHQVKNLFLYQDEDLQPKKNQIFLSIIVIFFNKTEGGDKKTTLSQNILLDNILLGRTGMPQTLIEWCFGRMWKYSTT